MKGSLVYEIEARGDLPSGAFKSLSNQPSSEPFGEDSIALIAEEAARFRAVLLENSRSSTLGNLFDYLLDRVGDARAPKEIEVAIAVFGKSGAFDTSQNSMVRSHMHRLRQRLKKFNADKPSPWLTIPKGEYRLTLSEASELGEEEDDHEPVTLARVIKHANTKRVAAIVISINALVWALVFLFGSDRQPPSAFAKTDFWNPIVSNGRVPVIATGDFFMVGKSGAEGMVERLVMNPKIQSGAQLSDYLMTHPEQDGTLRDRDIYRVPATEAKAAIAVLKMVSAMHPDAAATEITPVSRISQERIDSSNIIYIQYFSQIGMLRSPILSMSAFVPTDDFDEIKDTVSGEVYRARYSAEEDGPNGRPARADSYGYDFGYLASFPGSSDNHHIVISGIGDVGLSQMVKLVADRRQLDLLAKQSKGADAFEALYQVRTVGGLVFDTKLLVVRPLKMDASKEQAN